jgi:hypothetical protein
MAYDALRAVLDAFCILHEYKVLSHECLGKLVKDMIPNFDLVVYERYKYARNGINYYGTNVALEKGRALIKGMLDMKKEMERHARAMLPRDL